MQTVTAASEWAVDAYTRPLPPAASTAALSVLLNDLTMAQMAAGDLWLKVRAALGEGSPHHRCLVGAMRVHSLAMDSNDDSSQAHLGAAIIPALLCEDGSATGDDLVRALAIGWQVGSDLGASLLGRSLARGLRPSILPGALGACVAVGVLRGSTSKTIAESMYLASDMAGGAASTLVEGSDDWLIQLGRASYAARLASDLASAGACGGRSPLHEWLAESVQHQGYDAPGLEWAIAHASFKKYPVCNILQAGTSLACSAYRNEGIRGQEIDGVILHLAPQDANYPGIRNREPQAAVAAMMSGSFAIAASLTNGSLRHEHVARPTGDARVRTLERRVAIESDPSVALSGARLEVRLHRKADPVVFESGPWPPLVSRSALQAQLADMQPHGSSAESSQASLAFDVDGLQNAQTVPSSFARALWGPAQTVC